MRYFFRLQLSGAICALVATAPIGAQAGSAGAPQAAPAAPQGEPLAAFAAQRAAVMPVQFLRGDTAAPVQMAQWAAIRRELDDSIGAALSDRGLGKKWAYAADIERLAKRNTGYVSDPYALGAGSLRSRQIKPEDQAPMILVNNLRSLIAIGDARYALVPVELSFSGSGADARAVLRLVMLDGRLGQFVWFGDLAALAGTGFASAQIGELAQRVADLVARR